MMKVTILGAGTMGTQLALLCANNALDVTLWHYRHKDDVSKTINRLANINAKLGFIDKNEIETICDRISFTTDLHRCKEAEFVLEAIKEDLHAKNSLFRAISEIMHDSTIIASNTSTLSITELASLVNNPKRVLGIHFFNPPFSMKLVEVIKGEHTSGMTVDNALLFLESLHKHPVVLPETPGFVVNRLLFPMINEAIFLLSEGIANARIIDTCLKMGTNHPMGPLELADFIGLDVCLSILETLVNETGDGKYRPAPLLRKYVRAGKLGRKSGEGFYSYKRKA